MRNEMIGAVVRRAMEHPEFRKRLMESPGEALVSHGFALEDPEMARIEEIRSTLASSSDNEVEQQLMTLAEQWGVNPRT